MPKLVAEVRFNGEGQLPSGVTRNPLRVTLGRPLINEDTNSPFFLPLGLLCIASPVMTQGHDVSVVDLEYLYRAGRLPVRRQRWLDDCCEALLDDSPHVVGLTALADTLPTTLLIGRHIKQMAPGTVVVLGGPGTFGSFPGMLESFQSHVDFVCQGEGELAFAELVNALADGHDPHQVRGMWSLRDGKSNYRGGQPPTDLDLIPRPAYGTVPMTDYLELASPRIFDMHIGSGCTYACKFCMTSTFWDRDFRAKSPEVVLRDMDWLNEQYGTTRVNFLHDNFANKRAYLNSFIDYFIAHNTRYEWGCAVRPDNVNADLITRMQKAGCFNIFCGTDAGSEKILKQMQKMPSTKRTYEFFGACHEVGMPFETNTIIGYPDEGSDDLEAALDVVLDAVAYGAMSSDLSVLQPLPGAEVTNENLDSLVAVESALGTFLPDEVLDLVAEDLRRFPGFGFIRKGNRDYPYYVEILHLARYFTRRYHLYLRFLKQIGGLRYVDVFERLLGVPGDAISAALPDFLGQLTGDARAAAAGLLDYEGAMDALRAGDVLAELDNVYREPDAPEPGARYRVLDLPVDVLRIAADPVRLELSRPAMTPRSVLLYRAGAGEIRTMSLTPWHRDVVARLERHGTVDIPALSISVAEATGSNQSDATAAVSRVVETLRTILTEASRQPDELPTGV